MDEPEVTAVVVGALRFMFSDPFEADVSAQLVLKALDGAGFRIVPQTDTPPTALAQPS